MVRDVAARALQVVARTCLFPGAGTGSSAAGLGIRKESERNMRPEAAETKSHKRDGFSCRSSRGIG